MGREASREARRGEEEERERRGRGEMRTSCALRLISISPSYEASSCFCAIICLANERVSSACASLAASILASWSISFLSTVLSRSMSSDFSFLTAAARIERLCWLNWSSSSCAFCITAERSPSTLSDSSCSSPHCCCIMADSAAASCCSPTRKVCSSATCLSSTAFCSWSICWRSDSSRSSRPSFASRSSSHIASKTRFSCSSISSCCIFSPSWYARAAFVARMMACDSFSRSGSHARRHWRSYAACTNACRSASRLPPSSLARASICAFRCSGFMSSAASAASCCICSMWSISASRWRLALSAAPSAARIASNRLFIFWCSINPLVLISHSALAPAMKLLLTSRS